MRRTYRSKKDTGGALDHRDVILNMDERSSAFDAFYIQNIKQTKRELSCVGSSNAYGVASKKVRKRKYVKRIVKEVENLKPRESVSTSTYLTPDKSIRVNKILDPFDKLLNSSSTSQVAAAAKQCDKFGMLLSKKEGKTYIRNKLRKVKKFNYSSESFSDEDSEKENSTNLQSNTTDIRTHKLLVERELSDKPKFLDESINKIVNNLSLIKNNFKHKTRNSSFITSYKHRNRLTKNCQSPILQKSPLCSTPFKEKYRGKSIYNFSPITTKERGCPNYVTITEDNNESNNSLVFMCKEKVPKLSKEHTSPVTSIPVEVNIPEKSVIYEDEIDYPTLECENENLEQKSGLNIDNMNSKSTSTEQSLFKITEADQFLGFSDDKVAESIIDNNYCLLKCILERNLHSEKVNPGESHKKIFSEENIDETEEENNKSLKDKSLIKYSLKDDNLNENKSHKALQENLSEQDCDLNKGDTSLENSLVEDVDLSYENESRCINSDKEKSENPKASIIYKETSYSDSNNSSQFSDKESMYDTCESEQSFSELENNDVREPKVAVERLSDSVLMKYYDKKPIDKKRTSSCEQSFSELKNNDIKVPKIAIRRLNDSVFMKHYNKISINKESKSSCEHSFSELVNNDIKKPKVAIEKLNDSVFMKYYEKMPIDKESGDHMILTGQSQSEANETTSDANESLSEVEENLIEIDELNNSTEHDANASFYNCSQNSISGYSKNVETDSAGTQSHEIIITDSSTTEDIESNDESNNEDERHVSFVTTRRRNEITNDSMFIFDNSYGSSSTDCDKTVVSNKARLSILEKSNKELDISVKKVKTTDTNDFEPGDELTESENSTDIDRNTARNSSRHNRQSRSEYLDSNIKKVTIIKTDQIDDGRLINDVAPRKTKNTPEHTRSSVTIRKSSKLYRDSSMSDAEVKPSIVLQPGKKWERSLSIYRRMTTVADHFDQSLLDDDSQKKGRKYRQSVINTMEMQDSLHNESINSRRSTFISKPSRSTIRFVKDSNNSRISLNTTEVFDDLKGFLNEECDDTVIELSKLSLADSEFEVTVLDNFHETSARIATARDYVLRRCNQTDPILFDECYPETVLKNCHKIGEGVYGEVFLWRGRDGRARVMKIVPIAGAFKVNGEQQKDFHEVISEIVIAMELSALRAPIADIDRYFDEGKDLDALDLHSVENATDVFNEVLAVRCVQGPYPSRLLDLWELYDECKGSENDNPAALPSDQQYMVLELANAGQDLESYQFTGAQQAHALFQQIAFGLAVGEESFQFEHRDLHWGNVLIAPTEQKLATFILRGRTYRVPRGGVAATIIDYSLSRVSLALATEHAALYNDLATDEQLFEAVGDYQFQVYRLMRDKLGNEWKNFEPYTNILWLHYTVDKMITALRYKRTNTKIHKHYIEKLKGIKDRILDYKSATEYVLTDIEI